jgi:hypothetical protein
MLRRNKGVAQERTNPLQYNYLGGIGRIAAGREQKKTT